jgi:hypothetical protein
LIVVALKPVCTTTSSSVTPLRTSVVSAAASSRRKILPLQVFDRGDAQRVVFG